MTTQNQYGKTVRVRFVYVPRAPRHSMPQACSGTYRFVYR